MNDIQIQYFMSLVHHKSFSKAAEALYVSQAAVSKQISTLEFELEMTLFERKYRTVELTKAGEIMLNYFEHAIESFHSAINQVRKIDSCRTIRIGILEGIDMGDIHHQILTFRSYNSDIFMSITIGSMQQIIQDVISGNLDIGFTVLDEILDYPSIETQPVFPLYPSIFYSDKTHRSRIENPSCSDFRYETFFAPIEKQEKIIQHYIYHIERTCGFSPAKVECCTNLDSVISSVELGSGVALLYENVMLRYANQIKYVRCDSTKDMNMVWSRKNSNPNIAKLAEWLRPFFPLTPP